MRVESPTAFVFTSKSSPPCRLASAIRVVDSSKEGDQILWVVKLSASLFEFTFVYLKRGIQ